MFALIFALVLSLTREAQAAALTQQDLQEMLRSAERSLADKMGVPPRAPPLIHVMDPADLAEALRAERCPPTTADSVGCLQKAKAELERSTTHAMALYLAKRDVILVNREVLLGSWRRAGVSEETLPDVVRCVLMHELAHAHQASVPLRDQAYEDHRTLKEGEANYRQAQMCNEGAAATAQQILDQIQAIENLPTVLQQPEDQHIRRYGIGRLIIARMEREGGIAAVRAALSGPPPDLGPLLAGLSEEVDPTWSTAEPIRKLVADLLGDSLPATELTESSPSPWTWTRTLLKQEPAPGDPYYPQVRQGVSWRDHNSRGFVTVWRFPTEAIATSWVAHWADNWRSLARQGIRMTFLVPSNRTMNTYTLVRAKSTDRNHTGFSSEVRLYSQDTPMLSRTQIRREGSRVAVFDSTAVEGEPVAVRLGVLSQVNHVLQGVLRAYPESVGRFPETLGMTLPENATVPLSEAIRAAARRHDPAACTLAWQRLKTEPAQLTEPQWAGAEAGCRRWADLEARTLSLARSGAFVDAELVHEYAWAIAEVGEVFRLPDLLNQARGEATKGRSALAVAEVDLRVRMARSPTNITGVPLEDQLKPAQWRSLCADLPVEFDPELRAKLAAAVRGAGCEAPAP